MAFCAICGRYHEQGVGCFDGAGDLMKKSGINPPAESSPEELKQITRQANRWLVRVLLWAVAFVVLIFIVTTLFRKTG